MFSFPRQTEKGQGLLEYGLVLVLVAVVVVIIVGIFGDDVRMLYCEAIHEIAPEADLSEPCPDLITQQTVPAARPDSVNLAAVPDASGGPRPLYTGGTRMEVIAVVAAVT